MKGPGFVPLTGFSSRPLLILEWKEPKPNSSSYTYEPTHSARHITAGWRMGTSQGDLVRCDRFLWTDREV